MEQEPEERPQAPSYKALHVALALVVGVALVGYLAGTATTPRAAAVSERAATAGEAAPALRYEELRASPRRGPNAGWSSDLASAQLPQGEALPPGPERAEAQAAALRERAERRAYDGAPPTIPHPIDPDGPPECLVCHGEGMTFEGRTAPRMSHKAFASCTQCHAPEASPPPWAASVSLSAGNTFVGAAAVPSGERAWEGAPPTIPHATILRERCDSCHGPHGHPGLRSTHLPRQGCTQCHAPSASLDQRAP